MELTLKRIKATNKYTLSRLYDPAHRDVLHLDIVEPPLAGLTLAPLRTLDPGLYKLFLKTDRHFCELIPVFQYVAQRPRLSIVPQLVTADFEGVEFIPQDHFAVSMKAGIFDGNNLLPDKESFTRMVLRLCIAKKMKEKLFVHVKSL